MNGVCSSWKLPAAVSRVNASVGNPVSAAIREYDACSTTFQPCSAMNCTSAGQTSRVLDSEAGTVQHMVRAQCKA